MIDIHTSNYLYARLPLHTTRKILAGNVEIVDTWNRSLAQNKYYLCLLLSQPSLRLGQRGNQLEHPTHPTPPKTPPN